MRNAIQIAIDIAIFGGLITYTASKLSDFLKRNVSQLL